MHQFSLNYNETELAARHVAEQVDKDAARRQLTKSRSHAEVGSTNMLKKAWRVTAALGTALVSHGRDANAKDEMDYVPPPPSGGLVGSS